MTQRRALGDIDFDSAFDDPDNGWFGGHVQAAEPTSPRHPEDRSVDLPAPAPVDAAPDAVEIGTEDTDRWPVPTLDAPSAPEAAHVDESRIEYVDDLPPTEAPTARRWSDTPSTTTPSWESRLSGSGAWDFKVSAAAPRRYPPKAAVAAVIVAGLAVAGAVLFLRSPGAADDEAPVVAPSESTAQPAPTTSAPALSQAPLPPGLPPPPPPPPPTAEELNPPLVTRDYTPRRQNAPDDSDKPEIGVTRAPATRTQMSATPPPPRAPDRNSSTPGDGPKRNGFGF